MRSMPSSEAMLEGGHDLGLPAPQAPGLLNVEALSEYGDDALAQDDEHWLRMAQNNYSASTDFFDANTRQRLEEAMALYRNQHAPGSKYNTDAFAKRSKLFRPKTRAAVQKLEAAACIAFFSTQDMISCAPPNTGDPQQVAEAGVQNSLLNYRLRTTMNWFQIVVGAVQDASRQGLVIARTEWEWREGKRYFEVTDPVTGDKMYETETFVRRDTPKITMVPLENLRFDPGCNWIDPIESSPYLIEMVPYYIAEIREMTKNSRSKIKWRELSDEQLMSGMKHEYDSIRAKREGNRGDRYDRRNSINEYSQVWVHHNIVRIENEDYFYMTIGNEVMLCDPIPLVLIDPRGYRGYVCGTASIEAHNPTPEGAVTKGKPVQEEINEVANVRMDNVKMAAMGRYFVRRTSGVDMDALGRFVPGSSVSMGNINTDVKWDKPPEVNRSAYEEHNLLQLEYDDLMGNFTGASVGANRQMNETVGGMNLLGEGANQITELQLRTLVETFYEPLCGQTLDLIRLWETDVTVAEVVGQELGLQVKQVFKALNRPTRVSVNFGFGSTNPMKRVEKMSVGLGAVATYFPRLIESANQAEIAGEIFGALGFSNVDRFFPSLSKKGMDPQVKQLQDQVAQLTQMVEGRQLEFQSRERIAQITAESRIQIAQIAVAAGQQLAELHARVTVGIEKMRMAIKKIDHEVKFEQNAMKRAELYMQREALSSTIVMAEREFQMKADAMEQTTLQLEHDKSEKDGQARREGAEADQQTNPTQELIRRLRSPASNSVDLEDVGQQGDIAGVTARGQYGMIPGKEDPQDGS